MVFPTRRGFLGSCRTHEKRMRAPLSSRPPMPTHALPTPPPTHPSHPTHPPLQPLLFPVPPSVRARWLASLCETAPPKSDWRGRKPAFHPTPVQLAFPPPHPRDPSTRPPRKENVSVCLGGVCAWLCWWMGGLGSARRSPLFPLPPLLSEWSRSVVPRRGCRPPSPRVRHPPTPHPPPPHDHTPSAHAVGAWAWRVVVCGELPHTRERHRESKRATGQPPHQRAFSFFLRTIPPTHPHP